MCETVVLAETLWYLSVTTEIKPFCIWYYVYNNVDIHNNYDDSLCMIYTEWKISPVTSA